MVRQMKKKIMRKKARLNQKGVALIWVYLLSAFLTTMIYSFYSLNIWQTRTDVVDSSAEIQAFYLAEAAVDDMYKYINDQTEDGAAISTTINRGPYNLGTSGTYSSTYDPTNSIVNAIGTVSIGSGTITKKLFTKIVIGTPYDIPPGVQAGITAGSAVELAGLLVVDGRNHDAAGEAIEDGIPGVVYYENSDGLTYDDYVGVGGPSTLPNEPGNPIDPTSISPTPSNANLTSPEAVFGLSNGDLDAYKHSTAPTSPVDGVFYYEAPLGSGGTIDIDLGSSETPGSGVLVLDNLQNPTATVNLTGTFNGLVIVRDGNYNLAADTLVAGALVNVSASASTVVLSGPAYDPDGKNGVARILYCVQCIEATELPEGLNNSTVAGIGSWVNFRNATTSNPLVYIPASTPGGTTGTVAGGGTLGGGGAMGASGLSGK